MSAGGQGASTTAGSNGSSHNTMQEEDRKISNETASSPAPSNGGRSINAPTPALVSQLEARLVATEAELAQIEKSVAAIKDKVDAAKRCLRKRPSVNGDEVRVLIRQSFRRSEMIQTG